jgi:hypothetical protein
MDVYKYIIWENGAMITPFKMLALKLGDRPVTDW